MANQKGEWEGGLGAYSPKMYADLDMNDYRIRFPAETATLTDEQLFHVVSNTDDDTNDDEWRGLFKAG